MTRNAVTRTSLVMLTVTQRARICESSPDQLQMIAEPLCNCCFSPTRLEHFRGVLTLPQNDVSSHPEECGPEPRLSPLAYTIRQRRPRGDIPARQVALILHSRPPERPPLPPPGGEAAPTTPADGRRSDAADDAEEGRARREYCLLRCFTGTIAWPLAAF